MIIMYYRLGLRHAGAGGGCVPIDEIISSLRFSIPVFPDISSLSPTVDAHLNIAILGCNACVKVAVF